MNYDFTINYKCGHYDLHIYSIGFEVQAIAKFFFTVCHRRREEPIDVKNEFFRKF